MSAKEWKKARPILQPFFYDGWKHCRVERELAKTKIKQMARQEAGKRGGIAKANGKQTASKALASSSQPQSDSEAYASETRAGDGWPDDYREVFWQAFPNKIGKPKALAKLDQCRKRCVAWAELFEGLRRYVRDKPPDRSWLNPETFINQERWADQPALPLEGSKNGKIATTGSVAAAFGRLAEKFGAQEMDSPTGADPLLGLSYRPVPKS
jgi:hypothetical protein